MHEGSDLGIVYSPLHGTGTVSMAPALEACGFRNVEVLAAQASPDGAFPTVESPNPEEASALRMALDRAEETGAKLVLATDPDSDRVGAAFASRKAASACSMATRWRRSSCITCSRPRQSAVR